jgi:hypothetical protein
MGWHARQKGPAACPVCPRTVIHLEVLSSVFSLARWLLMFVRIPRPVFSQENKRIVPRLENIAHPLFIFVKHSGTGLITTKTRCTLAGAHQLRENHALASRRRASVRRI